jgi:hypothetical protein
MLKFLVFVLGTATALLILKYRLFVKDVIGNVGFAEKYFGTGGTHTLVIIIALIVFLASLLYSTGTLTALFKGPLALIFGL